MHLVRGLQMSRVNVRRTAGNHRIHTESRWFYKCNVNSRALVMRGVIQLNRYRSSSKSLPMTLPAKNRRRLRLEQGGFRYVFKPDKQADRGRLLIEPEYGSNTLVVNWLGLLKDKPNVLPRRFIRSTVVHAIAKGWPKKQLEIAALRDGDDLTFLDRPPNTPNNWHLAITWPQTHDNEDGSKSEQHAAG